MPAFPRVKNMKSYSDINYGYSFFRHNFAKTKPGVREIQNIETEHKDLALSAFKMSLSEINFCLEIREK